MISPVYIPMEQVNGITVPGAWGGISITSSPLGHPAGRPAN